MPRPATRHPKPTATRWCRPASIAATLTTWPRATSETRIRIMTMSTRTVRIIQNTSIKVKEVRLQRVRKRPASSEIRCNNRRAKPLKTTGLRLQSRISLSSKITAGSSLLTRQPAGITGMEIGATMWATTGERRVMTERRLRMTTRSWQAKPITTNSYRRATTRTRRPRCRVRGALMAASITRTFGPTLPVPVPILEQALLGEEITVTSTMARCQRLRLRRTSPRTPLHQWKSTSRT